MTTKKDDNKEKKNTNRETYSFMINNTSSEGQDMIKYLEDIRSNGGKIGNYIKKLIQNDMSKTNELESNTSLKMELLIEKINSQEAMLRNLTNIIEQQNKETSLLHTLLTNGVNINTNVTPVTSLEVTDDIVKDSDIDDEHYEFLKKANKAKNNIAPDLSIDLNDKNNSEEDNDISNEISFDFDDED